VIIPDTALFENTATIQFLTITRDVNFKDSVYITYTEWKILASKFTENSVYVCYMTDTVT